MRYCLLPPHEQGQSKLYSSVLSVLLWLRGLCSKMNPPPKDSAEPVSDVGEQPGGRLCKRIGEVVGGSHGSSCGQMTLDLTLNVGMNPLFGSVLT